MPSVVSLKNSSEGLPKQSSSTLSWEWDWNHWSDVAISILCLSLATWSPGSSSCGRQLMFKHPTSNKTIKIYLNLNFVIFLSQTKEQLSAQWKCGWVELNLVSSVYLMYSVQGEARVVSDLRGKLELILAKEKVNVLCIHCRLQTLLQGLSTLFIIIRVGSRPKVSSD